MLPHTKKLSFSMLVEKHQDTYVGYCLETGLVATALDSSDVVAKMTKLLDRQIKFALDNDRLQDIYHPAPAEIWKKWQDSEETVVSASQRSIGDRSTSGFMIAETTTYAAACC